MPVLSLTLLGALAVSVASLAGLLAAAAAWPALALCPLVSATLNHARPSPANEAPFPLEVLLLGGDVGAVVILVWLATGPILATLALTLPASIMFRADEGVSVAEASWMAAAVLLATVLVAVAYIWTRRQRE